MASASNSGSSAAKLRELEEDIINLRLKVAASRAIMAEDEAMSNEEPPTPTQLALIKEMKDEVAANADVVMLHMRIVTVRKCSKRLKLELKELKKDTLQNSAKIASLEQELVARLKQLQDLNKQYVAGCAANKKLEDSRFQNIHSLTDARVVFRAVLKTGMDQQMRALESELAVKELEKRNIQLNKVLIAKLSGEIERLKVQHEARNKKKNAIKEKKEANDI